jgi:two-component system sensor histidine kinase PilS (NtrC family)
MTESLLASLLQQAVELHQQGRLEPAQALYRQVLELDPRRFDALHLREVVLNLLNNAVRYASGGPESIRMNVVRDTAQRLELHVQDDGPGISPEVRAHLFEPFYTTSSKGTGLGLYLARELCLNNEARLDYEYRFDNKDNADGSPSLSGRFVITFAQQGKTV